jgi:S-adenosylmethionine:tRNA ribosyltransferase-isomerase
VSPAAWPRSQPLDERLLVIDGGSGHYDDARVRDLPRLLKAGDVVVLNDAATLPASLSARTVTGERACVEVRLLAERRDDAERRTWDAVLFGEGTWRTRTEERAPPPALAEGDLLVFTSARSRVRENETEVAEDGTPLTARVTSVSKISPRLVTLRFDSEGGALWSSIYRHGRPVQYAYVAAPLELWHVQTPYAARPWSVEMPSAGRPLVSSILRALASRGVEVRTLTHAAGLSSTGDAALDRALPLPEWFDIPSATVMAIERARARGEGARVVAVGTTVVRALEGSARLNDGAVVAGEAQTDLRIGGDFRPRIVDALFTGLHEPSASHFRILEAFAPHELLSRAYAHAERAGYLHHEFGDSCLLLRPKRAARKLSA